MKDKLWGWAGILRQDNITYQPPAGAILDGRATVTEEPRPIAHCGHYSPRVRVSGSTIT